MAEMWTKDRSTTPTPKSASTPPPPPLSPSHSPNVDPQQATTSKPQGQGSLLFSRFLTLDSRRQPLLCCPQIQQQCHLRSLNRNRCNILSRRCRLHPNSLRMLQQPTLSQRDRERPLIHRRSRRWRRRRKRTAPRRQARPGTSRESSKSSSKTSPW